MANAKSCLPFYDTGKTNYCQKARGFINVDKVQPLGKTPDFNISGSGIFTYDQPRDLVVGVSDY
jgi:hypothetical protein